MSAWSIVRVVSGIVITVLGTLCIVAAIPSALAVTTIEAAVGRTGVVTQPLGTLQSAPGDVAVIVDAVTARLVPPAPPEWSRGALALTGTQASDIAERYGVFTLVATPSDDRGAFIGVAPVDAVNEYLDGAPYSVAVREGDDWPAISVPGEGTPAQPPGPVAWTASATTASASAASIPAESLAGETLVLMRPDGAPDPRADLRLEFAIPGAVTALQSAAITAAAGSLGGLMLILLGAWLVVGRRRRES